jgi:penicillin-insensitive murein endopeptidase
LIALMVTVAAAGTFAVLRHAQVGNVGIAALAQRAPEAARPLLKLAQAATPAPAPAVTPPAEDEPTPPGAAPPEPPAGTPPGDAPVTSAPEETSPTAPQKSAKPMLADTIKVPPGMENVAKYLFAMKKTPSRGPSEAIGYYPRGCLAGGVALPINGPHWQVMRLSRNRNWGTPNLVRFVKNFSDRASKATGWNGILVGDMSQPRGGPALSGHMSHQTGLDVDIWFVPMPKEILTAEQREEMPANNLVASDWKHVDPKVYTPQHAAFIKTAAQMPEVERVLANAAIKKQLCETATGDRTWLAKVRPWYGHHDHIHVRLACPEGAKECKKQPPVTGSEGCADADFKFWFTKALVPPKPPTGPGRLMKLAELPAACKAVLAAP